MNTEDIFDVVNERDEIISRAPRSTVHAQGLLHRAAHIWLFRPNGTLLMQKRSPHKDRFPLCWTSAVSGHVDSGETYLCAAIREYTEELGSTIVPPLKLIAKHHACQETDLEFVEIYSAHVSEEQFPHFNTQEIDELRWFTREQLEQHLASHPSSFAPCFRHLWHLYGPLAP